MNKDLKQTVLGLLQSDLNHYNQAWDLDEDTNLLMIGVQTGDLIDWKRANSLVEKLEEARGMVYELVAEAVRNGVDLSYKGDFITTKAVMAVGLDVRYEVLLCNDFEMAVENPEELA